MPDYPEAPASNIENSSLDEPYPTSKSWRPHSRKDDVFIGRSTSDLYLTEHLTAVVQATSLQPDLALPAIKYFTKSAFAGGLLLEALGFESPHQSRGERPRFSPQVVLQAFLGSPYVNTIRALGFLKAPFIDMEAKLLPPGRQLIDVALVLADESNDGYRISSEKSVARKAVLPTAPGG